LTTNEFILAGDSSVPNRSQPKTHGMMRNLRCLARTATLVCVMALTAAAQQAAAPSTAASHPLSAAQVKELTDYTGLPAELE